VSAIFAVARADFRERTRTFALVVVIAATLQLGYLYVPDASAPYSTVDLGGWRGIYDSAWMGLTTAILTVSFLPIFGFFLVRPALGRDARLGTYEIVAAAPLGRTPFVFAKWASNVALLACLAALLVVAAMAMQLLRGENRTIDFAAYLIPFALMSLPACALTAAFAIAIDAVKPLRGIAGGVLWFFVWNALVAVPIAITQGRSAALVDPLGFSNLTAALLGGLHAAVPGANAAGSMTIGPSHRSTHVFHFPAVAWSASALAVRAAWFAFAALAVCAVAPFALAPPKQAKPRRLAALPARIVARLPLSRIVRAELAGALGAAGAWWLLGGTVLTVVALVVPAEALVRVVAPLIWIWPVGPIAAATVIDARANLDGVLLATPTPPWRRVLARWIACTALAIVPVAALALRAGPPPGLTLIAIVCALAAVAVMLGTLTRASLAFESLTLAVWYLGPVNRLPLLDPAAALASPAASSAVCVAIAACALGIATMRVGRRT
jgi:ABC-type transport system involved in multi-copper enzyme maturation permease subunit